MCRGSAAFFLPCTKKQTLAPRGILARGGYSLPFARRCPLKLCLSCLFILCVYFHSHLLHARHAHSKRPKHTHTRAHTFTHAQHTTDTLLSLLLASLTFPFLTNKPRAKVHLLSFVGFRSSPPPIPSHTSPSHPPQGTLFSCSHLSPFAYLPDRIRKPPSLPPLNPLSSPPTHTTDITQPPKPKPHADHERPQH